jgi:mannosyltransferase
MYSLVVLLVLLGLLAADALRRRGGAAPVVAVAVVSALLLYTHYWAIFLLATVGSLVLGRAVRRPAEHAVARRAVVGLVCGAATFLPWVPTFLYQSEHTGAPWAAPPDAASLARLPLDWAGGDGPAGTTLALVLVPLMLLAIFARHQGVGEVTLGRPRGVAAVLGLVVIGTLLLALAASIVGNGAVVGRYTAVVVPMVVLLIAFGILALPRAASVPLLAALVGVSLAAGLTIVRTTHSHAGDVADAINERARPGDLVVYCPDQLAPAIEARLQPDLEVDRLTVPRQSDPRIVNWIDYTRRIESMGPRYAAETVLAYLKSAETASVWYVAGKNYRTHENVCGPLRTRLVAALGVPSTVVAGTARGHEKATLERFAR